MMQKYKRISILILTVFGLVAFVAGNVKSAETNSNISEYKAYLVDVDGDGLKDIYLKSPPEIIIIFSDPSFPIDINNDPVFFLKANSPWGDYLPPSKWLGSKPSLLNALELNVIFGEIDTSPDTVELFIQSGVQGQSSVTVSFNGYVPQGYIYEFQQSLIEGQDISSEISTVTLSDANGDGRDDLVIRHNATGEVTTIHANANGSFGEQNSQIISDDEKTLNETWFGLQSALKSKNVSGALSYFTNRSKNKHSEVFNRLYNDLPDIVNSIRNFNQQQITQDYAVYSVNRTIDGIEYLFFINFKRDENHNWLIESM